MNRIPSERAYIRVLVIFFFIGAVGFAALAVDGGRVYTEKRQMQSAAESAAYAAALAGASNQDYRAAALEQARLNRYSDGDASANADHKLDIQVYNPPLDGPYAPQNLAPGLDPNIYYQVKIRSDIDQIFSQFLNRTPMIVTVDAVAYLLPHASIPAPDCAELLPLRTYKGGSAILEPGYYPAGIAIHDGDVQLQLLPGVYCLDEPLVMRSGKLIGKDVLIIMNNGGFWVSGSTQVQLSAWAPGDPEKDFNGIDWGGMLLYMPDQNRSSIHLGGTSASMYSGTIYAPGPTAKTDDDKCIIADSDDSLTVSPHINCYTTKIIGEPRMDNNSQVKDYFYLPPQVALAE